MIRCEQLRAGYRTGFRRVWREVLQGVDFHVPKGSVTGYLGINGAGKSTTIKVLVGVNPPSGGKATIGGHPAGTPPAQRLVGYFPEAPLFYDGLSAVEHLDFYGRLAGLDRTERLDRGRKLLDEVGLADAAERPVRGYSKGMRQRLGLAQSLLHEPELLILDEPLDGLDPMGRLHLRELVAAQGKRGKTVFFSTHVLSDVEAVADRIVVLDGARVAFEGPPGGLIGGGPPRVEVHVAVPGDGPEREAALAALRSASGAEPVARPDGTLAVDVPAEKGEATLDAARAHGARLVAVTPLHPSLEETFLARFGKGQRPAEAKTA